MILTSWILFYRNLCIWDSPQHCLFQHDRSLLKRKLQVSLLHFWLSWNKEKTIITFYETVIHYHMNLCFIFTFQRHVWSKSISDFKTHISTSPPKKVSRVNLVKKLSSHNHVPKLNNLYCKQTVVTKYSDCCFLDKVTMRWFIGKSHKYQFHPIILQNVKVCTFILGIGICGILITQQSPP